MSQETFNKSGGQDYNYLTFLKTHSFIHSLLLQYQYLKTLSAENLPEPALIIKGRQILHDSVTAVIFPTCF